MKEKLFKLVVALCLFTFSHAENKVTIPQCDNKSTCVNDKNFYVEVKRVVRRGDVIVVQLAYRGKTSRQYHFEFSTFNSFNSFKGYVVILDAMGNEFKVPGKEISNFFLSKGENKIVSLKFRGDKKKKIVEPFDLTIKTRNDEITLFDLKQESRFRQVVSSGTE